MRIIREQNAQKQYETSDNVGRPMASVGRRPNGLLQRDQKLCGHCDKLKYCQYARNLSHNHAAHFTSHIIIGNGEEKDVNQGRGLSDQHTLAEKLKLRYKTCPFHRELSLG